MKPYNERLPLIDEAIEYHKGKWPKDDAPHGEECLVLLDNGNYITTLGIPGKDGYLCNKYQFEKRAKELGWVNGYKWGVEYKTNGEKPHLPDDVEVELFNGLCWTNPRNIEAVSDWASYSKCRVVDDRYKPDSDTDVGSNWYKRGGLPPVGEVVEVYVGNADYWAKVKVLAVDGGNVVWRNGSDGLSYIGTPLEYVRPPRTETEKLVEQIADELRGCELSLTGEQLKIISKHLIEQGYRKIKPMEKDEFVSEIQAELSEFKTNWASHLYHAGCRFIDKGGNDE